jgi:type II secretory pathway component GspD/PulD (secretin)
MIKRYIFTILLCAGIVAIHTGCSLMQGIVLPEEKVSMSFYDAPATGVIDYLSQLADLPVSYDPAVEDITITLVTPEPVSVTEAEKLIAAAFEVQDCIVTREKNAITIRKAP